MLYTATEFAIEELNLIQGYFACFYGLNLLYNVQR